MYMGDGLVQNHTCWFSPRVWPVELAFRLIVSELQRNSGVKEDSSKTKTDDVDAEMPETKENGTAAVVEDEVVNEQELKYWKAVKENPSDFTSWTYLLQFVEQEVCQRLPIWFSF